MDLETFLRRRVGHALRTGLLLLATVAMLAAVGLVVAGPVGLVWSVTFGALAVVVGPAAAPSVLLRATRARPLGEHELPGLHEALTTLAARAGLRRTPALWVVPDAAPNAFTVGRRDDAVIAVSRGLLRWLDAREVVGVLAHETSHIRNGDVWLLSAASIAHRLTGLLAAFGRLVLFVSLPLMLLGLIRVPLLALLVLAVAPMASALVQLALSRTREFDADLEAARLTGDPAALASALQRLDEVTRPWWRRALMPSREPAGMLSSHPPTAERVRRLMALSRTPHART